MNKNDKDTKSAATSPGPYTPLTTPVEVGQESGGEYNWNRASATPPPKR